MGIVLGRKTIASSVAVVALGLGVAACGSSESSESPAGGEATSTAQSSKSSAPTSKTITLVEAGAQDFSGGDVPYFMQLLEKQGYHVEYSGVADASSGLRTVVSGQDDLFIGSLPTAILAVHSGGAQIKVIAVNDQASDYVLVSPTGVSLSNLSNATLAIDTPGSAGQVAAEIALRNAGVNKSQFHAVTVGNSSARETAVLAGRIDIAPLHYPDALAAVETGKVKILVNAAKEIGPYPQSGLIASDQFLENKEEAQQVVNDFIEAERWAATEKASYISFAEAHKLTEGLSAKQAEETWDFYHEVKFFGVNGGICPKYIEAFTEVNQEIGDLPSPMPSQSEWLEPAFVQSFLKAHNQEPNAC